MKEVAPDRGQFQSETFRGGLESPLVQHFMLMAAINIINNTIYGAAATSTTKCPIYVNTYFVRRCVPTSSAITITLPAYILLSIGE